MPKPEPRKQHVLLKASLIQTTELQVTENGAVTLGTAIDDYVRRYHEDGMHISKLMIDLSPPTERRPEDDFES